jgi:pimeloyl-ACP methyl ester carboxylesterase
VIYLDQRGSGRSDRSEPAKWTWERWADDVAGFCRAVGIGRCVLVGSSSGGMVGMLCAARHSELVARLVLDSTFGVPTTLEESLEVFDRRGGPVAREAARRYLGGGYQPCRRRGVEGVWAAVVWQRQ